MTDKLTSKRLAISNYIVSPLILMGFWLIMSGKFDLIHILMGVLCVGFVLALNYPLRRHRYFEDDVDLIKQLRLGRLVLYLPWLLYQIILSAVQVARVILSPRLPVKPRVMRFTADLPSAQAKMILGNSITLTPGTLTVDINGDEFIVHAIVPDALNSLIDDSMPRQVLQLFSREEHEVIRDYEVITHSEKLS